MSVGISMTIIKSLLALRIVSLGRGWEMHRMASWLYVVTYEWVGRAKVGPGNLMEAKLGS